MMASYVECYTQMCHFGAVVLCTVGCMFAMIKSGGQTRQPHCKGIQAQCGKIQSEGLVISPFEAYTCAQLCIKSGSDPAHMIIQNLLQGPAMLTYLIYSLYCCAIMIYCPAT